MKIESVAGVMQEGWSLMLIQGDITEFDGDAIVNAANSKLQHRGGVAGALARKGKTVQRESNELLEKMGRDVNFFEAVRTSAGELKAAHLIHVVGPYMTDNTDPVWFARMLGCAVRNALSCAEEWNCQSIAFPIISSGIFGGSLVLCSDTIVQTVLSYFETCLALDRQDEWVPNVTIVAYDEDAARELAGALDFRMNECERHVLETEGITRR